MLTGLLPAVLLPFLSLIFVTFFMVPYKFKRFVIFFRNTFWRWLHHNFWKFDAGNKAPQPAQTHYPTLTSFIFSLTFCAMTYQIYKDLKRRYEEYKKEKEKVFESATPSDFIMDSVVVLAWLGTSLTLYTSFAKKNYGMEPVLGVARILDYFKKVVNTFRPNTFGVHPGANTGKWTYHASGTCIMGNNCIFPPDKRINNFSSAEDGRLDSLIARYDKKEDEFYLARVFCCRCNGYVEIDSLKRLKKKENINDPDLYETIMVETFEGTYCDCPIQKGDTLKVVYRHYEPCSDQLFYFDVLDDPINRISSFGEALYKDRNACFVYTAFLLSTLFALFYFNGWSLDVPSFENVKSYFFESTDKKKKFKQRKFKYKASDKMKEPLEIKTSTEEDPEELPPSPPNHKLKWRLWLAQLKTDILEYIRDKKPSRAELEAMVARKKEGLLLKILESYDDKYHKAGWKKDIEDIQAEADAWDRYDHIYYDPWDESGGLTDWTEAGEDGDNFNPRRTHFKNNPKHSAPGQGRGKKAVAKRRRNKGKTEAKPPGLEAKLNVAGRLSLSQLQSRSTVYSFCLGSDDKTNVISHCSIMDFSRDKKNPTVCLIMNQHVMAETSHFLTREKIIKIETVEGFECKSVPDTYVIFKLNGKPVRELFQTKTVSAFPFEEKDLDVVNIVSKNPQNWEDTVVSISTTNVYNRSERMVMCKYESEAGTCGALVHNLKGCIGMHFSTTTDTNNFVPFTSALFQEIENRRAVEKEKKSSK